MSPQIRHRGLRPAVAAVALSLAALALSACVSPRNTLGTSSSLCYRALPVASEAVHDRGTLAGIRLVSPKEIGRHHRLLQVLDQRTGGTLGNVCVVSFRGQFRQSQVQRPLGSGPAGGTGQFAIVIVSSPGNGLLGTFVLTRVPLPLRHEVLRPLRH
ncbi:MAG TPA: hypothetical protein VMV14_05930 [Acidimicrobiales bacterium]|nr:hypothetical protein [Acidimicrobiales bacterium]